MGKCMKGIPVLAGCVLLLSGGATVEFVNLVLALKLMDQEKKDLVAYMLVL